MAVLASTQSIHTFPTVPHLADLSTAAVAAGWAELTAIARHSLTSLELRGCGLRGLGQLRRLQSSLRSLDVLGCDILASGWSRLSALTHLTRLCGGAGYAVVPASIEALTALQVSAALGDGVSGDCLGPR